MRTRRQKSSTFGRIAIRMTLATVIATAFISAGAPAQAQTFTVLHSFTGGADGTKPESGVVLDRAGNLYGTTSGGLNDGDCNPPYCGGVFKLTRHGSAWILNSLYMFQGGTDGAGPANNLLLAPDGTVYGSTFYGGDPSCGFNNGCGIAFQLRPPLSVCRNSACPWNETILYSFNTLDGGLYPSSPLVRDAAGNLYGTAAAGGNGSPYGCLGFGCGAVFKLTHSQGGWTEDVLYAFTGASDGGTPEGSIVLDQNGNIDGSSNDGGNYVGVVYQVTPSGAQSTLAWLPTQMGAYGYGLISDAAGNLYGSAQAQGPNGGGSVYEVSPGNGGWNINLVYALSGPCCNPIGPRNLVMDQAGNLYGTSAYEGGYGYGVAFKLTPSADGWSYTDLYDFTGGSDGIGPNGPLAVDSNGTLYGTTEAGGDTGHGVIFQITQ